MANTIQIEQGSSENYFYKEAIKTLRTNIQFSGAELKVIMLTSSVPGEGKSETSFAIAESFTQIGKKVLLIDADIRSSKVIQERQINQKISGLTEYLTGQKQLGTVVCQTNVEGLDIILAGPNSVNPTELLEGQLFQTMLETLKGRYDYIIIDTPPMASLIDGAIISKNCDGAVIVVKNAEVSYRLVQRVKSQLEKSGCTILGSVLTHVDVKKNRYYYGKYARYGKYDAYYE